MNLLDRILYRFIRPLVVTEDEERTLAWANAAAPNAELLNQKADLEDEIDGLRHSLATAAAHDAALAQFRAALEAPQRYMPDPGITPAEAKAWEAMLTGPLGVKIDTAMINWTQQQCQSACAPTADERDYAAGFARGTVVSWQMAKTLSRIALAHQGEPETDESTASAGLEHHTP